MFAVTVPETGRAVARICVSVSGPETAIVPLPALAVTVPLTGCVAWKNVPETGTATARSCASVSPSAVGFETVTVPETGCVACQNVPDTGSAVARIWVSVRGPETGWVACQKAPLTAIVPEPAFAVTVPDTGCVACQKVPDTGCVPLGMFRVTRACSVPAGAEPRTSASPDAVPSSTLPPLLELEPEHPVTQFTRRALLVKSPGFTILFVLSSVTTTFERSPALERRTARRSAFMLDPGSRGEACRRSRS
jgi:hypothetical protein